MLRCGHQKQTGVHPSYLSGGRFYHQWHLHSTVMQWRHFSAFITGHVDYCSVFTGICASPSTSKPSAFLIVKKRKFDLIMTTIRDELDCQQWLVYQLCTACAGACIRVHHRIYHLCVFMLTWLTINIKIFVQQLVVNVQLIKCMNHKSLLRPVHLYGTHSIGS